MNKFRNLPAVITLLAGFITSVIMILHRYSLVNFMWILVCTMLVFYMCGVIIRFALNKVVRKTEDKKNRDKTEDEEPEEDGGTSDDEENAEK